MVHLLVGFLILSGAETVGLVLATTACQDATSPRPTASPPQGINRAQSSAGNDYIIVETARDYQAGVIVMGSHGRGDLVALLLGSVAHKVVHLADCPVLIVR